MAKFEVEVVEKTIRTVVVEANTEVEAIVDSLMMSDCESETVVTATAYEVKDRVLPGAFDASSNS